MHGENGFGIRNMEGKMLLEFCDEKNCVLQTMFPLRACLVCTKGRVSSGEYSNLGTQGKDFQKLMFSKKEKEF